MSLIVISIPVSSTFPKSGLTTVPKTRIDGERLMYELISGGMFSR